MSVDEVAHSHAWSSSSGKGSKSELFSFPVSKPGVRGWGCSFCNERRKR